MELKIRYENGFQTIVLDTEETEGLWVSLDLEEDEELTQKEKEQRIQKAFDDKYNKPEYNCWHKFDRHRGYSKAKPGKDEEEIDTSEPLMSEVMDDRIFRKDEIEREERQEYDAICKWVKKTLIKKPNWASAFIAVRMDGVSVNDYAASIGVSDASIVSKWLSRATKKLKENWDKRQI